MASQRQKLCTTVNAKGVVSTDPFEPVREERFNEGDNAKTRADQLTRLQQAIVEVTKATRANRRNQAWAFEDVPVHTVGTQIKLRHGLGRRVRWSVVDWQPTVAGNAPNIECFQSEQTDPNLLILRSYVAGTATIEVW
jgi:hypothetical protein